MTGDIDRKKLLRYGTLAWMPTPAPLRRQVAEGLEVRVASYEVRRGEEIMAWVVVGEPDRFDGLEVGLVCTETYDTVIRGGSQSPATRGTAVTYDGRWLSFRWEIVARGLRRRARDLQASQAITVLP